MGSVKTSGGLTWGHGMSEVQYLVWFFSMPACAVNRAMQEGTSITSDTNEEHKDVAKPRQEHD